MITKVCIDNFRCFQNFELELSPLCLLLGDNGSGKSTFLDAISRVRDIVGGARVDNCFGPCDLTAWDNRPKQVFSLEMRCGDDQYRYELKVTHDFPMRNRWISWERLLWNSRPLYECGGGHARVYRESGASDVASCATFPIESFIVELQKKPGDNEPLHRFQEALDKLVLLRLAPAQMEPSSSGESTRLRFDGGNFSSWYRYLARAHREVVDAATESLRETIPGFDCLRLADVGGAEWLVVSLAGMAEPIPILQLSDGQRALVVLHTLGQAARRLGYDLFIDEPDNFISLREMQGLVGELEDLYLEDKQQVVLVSHHPEFVNALAATHGIFFTRLDNGAVKARIGYPVFEGLTAAETMARGWDDEEE